jgi:lipoprotein-anchoring transpeptidase ErfK/SrfK
MIGENVVTLRAPLGLAIGAAAVSAVLVLSACSGSGKTDGAGSPSPATASSSSTSTSAGVASSVPPGSSTATGRPVHIKLLEDDSNGPVTYGVGMPIVTYFSAKITDASAFAKTAKVTINGVPNAGSWYFESSAIIAGYPLEAHYRPAATPGASDPYWPAHASIKLDLPTKGVSAGTGLVFDDSLTLSMKTGAAHISYVDCQAETMRITSDGASAHANLPTSCGAAKTPTYTGTKVVMQKGEDTPGADTLRPQGAVQMIGSPSDPYDLIVPWSVRITQSGEYVHAASWNGGNIGVRSTSNGCTNLNTADAEWFYNFAQVGDVVIYTNTGGSVMPSWDGFGDWNVPQSVWSGGGAVAA